MKHNTYPQTNNGQEMAQQPPHRGRIMQRVAKTALAVGVIGGVGAGGAVAANTIHGAVERHAAAAAAANTKEQEHLKNILAKTEQGIAKSAIVANEKDPGATGYPMTHLTGPNKGLVEIDNYDGKSDQAGSKVILGTTDGKPDPAKFVYASIGSYDNGGNIQTGETFYFQGKGGEQFATDQVGGGNGDGYQAEFSGATTGTVSADAGEKTSDPGYGVGIGEPVPTSETVAHDAVDQFDQTHGDIQVDPFAGIR